MEALHALDTLMRNDLAAYSKPQLRTLAAKACFVAERAKTEIDARPCAHPARLSSLPEALLYHTLTFVDENDDARCAGLDKSWARLRRVWVVSRRRNCRIGQVMVVAFSRDGTLLAVGAKDDVLTVHDAATGDLRRTFPRARARSDVYAWTTSLAFSPTDSTVLVAGGIGDIITCDTATGESCELWRALVGWSVDTVTYSQDGSTVAFCHEDAAAVIGVAGLMAVSPARVLATTPGEGDIGIRGVAFSSTGSVLAVGIGTKVKCFDLATGQVRTEIEHRRLVWTVGFSLHGTVSAGGQDGKLAFYDAFNGQLQRELRPAATTESTVGQSCFSPDGSAFAAECPRSRPWELKGPSCMSIYDAEAVTCATSSAARAMLSGQLCFPRTERRLRWATTPAGSRSMMSRPVTCDACAASHKHPPHRPPRCVNVVLKMCLTR